MFDEGRNRREFLKCMAWAGTGALFAFDGGVGSSIGLDAAIAAPIKRAAAEPFTFVQLSDSHIGFNKPPNADARATFREAIAKVKALPSPAGFRHSHRRRLAALARRGVRRRRPDAEGSRACRCSSSPASTTCSTPTAARRSSTASARARKGAGWYSFDHRGVHFVALVNVADLKPGGMGNLGAEQLTWLKADLAGRSSSTPIVVFAHIPLWTVYAEWGWGTDDAAEALKLLAPVRIGDRAQRPHPPDHAEGRRAGSPFIPRARPHFRSRRRAPRRRPGR